MELLLEKILRELTFISTLVLILTFLFFVGVAFNLADILNKKKEEKK